MPRLLCVCLLWLGLLLVRFSRELSEISRARRLCGRHLLKEIVELCGNVNWSYFEEEPPPPPLFPQDNEIETFIPDRSESSQTTFPAWARGTNPGKTGNRGHVCASLCCLFPKWALPGGELPRAMEFVPKTQISEHLYKPIYRRYAKRQGSFFFFF